MKRYTFKYGYWAKATVTVYAKDEGLAIMKARDIMDKRYEKLNKEPPVAWSLELVGVVPDTSIHKPFFGVEE